MDFESMDAWINEVDARRALLTAFAQEEQRERWQPIETAPKDGTRVLLATDAGVHAVEWIDGLWMVDDLKHGPYALRRYMVATNWQPLPKPPTF